MIRTIFLLVAAVPLCTTSGLAQQPAAAEPAAVDRVIAATFKSATEEWKKKIEQDETQKACSANHGNVSGAAAQQVLARAKSAVKLPADGQVMGDWKKGEQLAQRGTGGQFSDGPATPKGGNCYACHQLAAAELSYGTLGPSLLGYGKSHKFAADAARETYIKIYDPQAVLPCSSMPRFGHNGFLTEQDIKDAVAYLFDPESPVNK